MSRDMKQTMILVPLGNTPRLAAAIYVDIRTMLWYRAKPGLTRFTTMVDTSVPGKQVSELSKHFLDRLSADDLMSLNIY